MLKMENCKMRFESLPSLRGDVNEVDRGELLTLKIKNLELKMKSTPPSGKPDTSPQSREGLRKVCVALLQGSEGLRKVCVALPQGRGGLESLPSLRGDVNEVDRGELLTSEIKNLELKMKSTPPPLRGTSPQSREGLKIKYY